MLSHEKINKTFFTGTIKDKERHIFTNIYKFMFRLRKIEMKIKKEYHPRDLMRCPIHFCIGQEAVPSVLNAIIKKNDYLFSHHRSHGYYFAKGCGLKEMISELHGKSTGANGGFAGSQDISNYKKNFYAGAILSGSIGIAIGTAFAIKYKKINSKVIVAFGEGAIDQGIFWEAINFASLYNLPILFLCENNLYATYSKLKDRVSNFNICEKVSSFGVKSKQVFGNDAIEIYKEIKSEYNNLRNSPFFFEFLTYRISSHVGPENDSLNYRNHREMNKWINLCPIKNLKSKLKLSKKNTQFLNKRIDTEINSHSNLLLNLNSKNLKIGTFKFARSK